MQPNRPSKLLILFLCFIGFSYLPAQNQQFQENTSHYFHPEILVGKATEPNEGFPKTNLQTGFTFGLGRYNLTQERVWAKWLNFPKTGISASVYDFGNTEKVGRAYTIMPFMEYDLSNRLHINAGIGLSYTDTKFDPVTNPFNEAITTDLNWSFRSFFYYDVFKKESIDWRFGLGYVHHSNGHTRLPNQGLNSFLASVSAFIKTSPEIHQPKPEIEKTSTRQTYFSFKAGLGQNVLSEIFNNKKEVYSVAVSVGRIHNKTFKFGGGLYYRFYEHYYDYIKSDGELVVSDYPIFKENPFGYASAYGLFGTAELLLSHFGVEFDIGINISKPFYKIDWILNQGYDFVNPQGETIVVLGELDWYYEIKRTISSRLGLKYYFITNDKSPKHNIFIGAHINANLGQADFTELSLGYVYRLPLKEKTK
ncbi:acyloxyacyl hydrolase [Winogradskyella sp. 3972H.M.0a.05]|uniref:acyloxyacyl hydrolase n=1 Tax=Winogradskyella sp. 3972H.M.0a.05 TaxID=2950277 RepID=UPI003397A679